MTERRRLPNRRLSETYSFRWASMDFVATVSRFDTGELAELFLSNGHVDSMADVAAKDGAILTSLLLQHGVSLDAIRHSLLRNSQGIACGVICTALDLIDEHARTRELAAVDAEIEAYDREHANDENPYEEDSDEWIEWDEVHGARRGFGVLSDYDPIGWRD